MNILLTGFMQQFVDGEFVLKFGRANRIFVDIEEEKIMLIYAKDAPIYADIYGGNGKQQYFKDDPIYIVLEQRGRWYMVRHHSLADGITGWFKVSDVQPYNPYRNKYITIA